ncbi:MAG: ABC transporter substrate-binding protein [Methanococcaceae archaeon]
MMKSKLLLFLLIFASLLAVQCKKQTAGNKSSVKKIAFLSFGPDAGADIVLKGYLDGLKNADFFEGKNLEVFQFNAAGDMANIPSMMKNADFKGYDLLIPMTTPCLAAAVSSVKNSKMVFCYVYDPIAAGAGNSFSDHYSLATGIGSFPPVDETADFIQKIVPGIKRLGIIYNSSEANSRKVVEVGKETMRKRGIELVEVTITGTNEISQAAKSLVKQNIQAIWVSGDNTVLQGFSGVVKETKAAKLPLIINDPEFVEQGALAAIGIGWYQTGLAAAKMGARILNGENPKDIPIENVAVRKVVLNNKSAQQLGIIFPKEVIQGAEIIN